MFDVICYIFYVLYYLFYVICYIICYLLEIICYILFFYGVYDSKSFIRYIMLNIIFNVIYDISCYI